MRLIQALIAAFVALLLGIAPAAAQTYPKLTGRVVDAANVLPAATKADLSAKLQALERDTKRQLIVATIPDLQGRELVEYGVGLGRAWGVGLKDVDNGAILFIAPNEPKGHRGPRLEVGRGLEPILTDAFSGMMIRSEMMPRLQSGDVAGAMEAGTNAVIAQLRASPEEQKARVDAAAAEFNRTHRSARSHAGGFPFGIIIFAFVAGFILLSFGRRAGGQRYAGGGGDSGLMPVILWGLANEIGNQASRGSWGGGSGWGGGGSGGSSGGSDSGWGGSDFSGGGGGDFGGGGASGDW